MPKWHKRTESTDIILQMVECGRGVAALPRWLVVEQQSRFDIHPIRLGKNGIAKQIHVGVRSSDLSIDYVAAFLKLAISRKKTSHA